MMTKELPEAPAYFEKDAELNRTGAGPLIGTSRVDALAAADVKQRANAGQIILDVRALVDRFRERPRARRIQYWAFGPVRFLGRQSARYGDIHCYCCRRSCPS